MNVSQAHARRFFGMIGPLQIAIIVLVLITAGIHLQYGMSMNPGGFRGGVPGGQPGGPGSRAPGGSLLQNTIGLIDKGVEVVLIILLLIDDRQSVRSKRSEVMQSASPQ